MTVVEKLYSCWYLRVWIILKGIFLLHILVNSGFNDPLAMLVQISLAAFCIEMGVQTFREILKESVHPKGLLVPKGFTHSENPLASIDLLMGIWFFMCIIGCGPVFTFYAIFNPGTLMQAATHGFLLGTATFVSLIILSFILD